MGILSPLRTLASGAMASPWDGSARNEGSPPAAAAAFPSSASVEAPLSPAPGRSTPDIPALSGPVAGGGLPATILHSMACEAAPGIRRSVAVVAASGPPVTDPVFHGHYTAAVQGYVLEIGERRRWQQKFQVYYQEGSQAIAATTAELLCRFYCYGEARLEPRNAFIDPAIRRDSVENPLPGATPKITSMYLDNGAAGGGREQEGMLYLFQVLQPRHPVELAREVAHEFSHLTVPGIRGFSPPRAALPSQEDSSTGDLWGEDWANGYLGEVMYLEWLGDDSGATGLSSREAGTWGLRREQALEGAFLGQGPATLFSDPGRQFWPFIGMLLYLRQMYGLPLLARFLEISHHPGRELAASAAINLADAIAAIRPGAIAVPGALASEVGTGTTWSPHPAGQECLLPPEGTARAWVYLRAGSYRLRVGAVGNEWQVRGACVGDEDQWTSIGSFSATAPEGSFTARREAWYHVQWRNTGTRRATIWKWTWTPGAG